MTSVYSKVSVCLSVAGKALQCPSTPTDNTVDGGGGTEVDYFIVLEVNNDNGDIQAIVATDVVGYNQDTGFASSYNGITDTEVDWLWDFEAGNLYQGSSLGQLGFVLVAEQSSANSGSSMLGTVDAVINGVNVNLTLNFGGF